MFEQLKNKVLRLGKVAGIEITFLTENACIINCIILELRKGKLIITQSFYNLKNIAELEGKIPWPVPVALVINGKGVIQKKLPSGQDTLLTTVLPGVNPNDFFIQYYKNNYLTDVSLLRNDTATRILSDLRNLKINVTSLSLGFYDITQIERLIDHNGNIPATNYQLNFKNNCTTDYIITTTEEKEIVVKPEINLGTEYIKSNFIIAYSAAVKLFSTGLHELNKSNPIVLLENRQDFRQSRLLKFYGWLLLSISFIVLLLNFIVYNYFFTRTNQLASDYSFAISQGARSDSMKVTLQRKKSFLHQTGWLNDSKMISFYADRVANTVPDSVTLTSMNIYPAISRSSYSEKQWNFQKDTILITGKCSDPAILNEWTNRIEKLKNVKQARINNFLFKKQNEPGTFTVELFIK